VARRSMVGSRACSILVVSEGEREGFACYGPMDAFVGEKERNEIDKKKIKKKERERVKRINNSSDGEQYQPMGFVAALLIVLFAFEDIL
jgi:hypothetical protein